MLVFSNSLSGFSFSFLGGECQPGFYCPVGSSSPLLCPGGFYCETRGLSNFTAKCKAGHYCTNGSWTAEPGDGSGVGGVCPEGAYCEKGTDIPEKCPAGKMSASKGFCLFHMIS